MNRRPQQSSLREMHPLKPDAGLSAESEAEPAVEVAQPADEAEASEPSPKPAGDAADVALVLDTLEDVPAELGDPAPLAESQAASDESVIEPEPAEPVPPKAPDSVSVETDTKADIDRSESAVVVAEGIADAGAETSPAEKGTAGPELNGIGKPIFAPSVSNNLRSLKPSRWRRFRYHRGSWAPRSHPVGPGRKACSGLAKQRYRRPP